MNKTNLSQKVKNIKGISREIAPFLEKEHFSKEEIELLPFFFEKSKIKKSDKIFLKEKFKKALKNLIRKKIIVQKKWQGDHIYLLESLESFFSWIRENTCHKIRDIENNSNAFIDLLRSSLGNAIKSKVTFYEGIKGIRESYYHILDNAEGEICAYYSVLETVQPELQDFFEKEYAPERAKRNIFSRNIAPRTPKTTYFKIQSDELNMEIRQVPPNVFPILNSEINLYGGKYMHCMIFDELGGFAVIIEGEDMVKLHKALFEIAWQNCRYTTYEKLGIASANVSDEKFWEHVYLTDNIESVLINIDKRRDKFVPDLKDKWPTAKPEYTTTIDGENILKICNLEVMSDFEKPYMKKLAKIATTHGGKILNIGFGLGMVDDFIEDSRPTRKITEHHIVELNDDVFSEAKKWRDSQSHKKQIFLHKGDWEDVLAKFQKNGIVFDGIVYDGFPLDIDEICRDAIRFLYSLIRLKLVRENSGIVTFYMDSTDGFGNTFQKYLQILGVRDIQIKKVDIDLPNRDCEYWNQPFFLAPLLTDITYSEK